MVTTGTAIQAYAAASPGASYTELACNLEASHGHVASETRRLANAGRVRIVAEGGVARVYPARQQRQRPRRSGPAKILHCADLFCGGGGFSQGMGQALEGLGHDLTKVNLVAINHDETAIATHAANHPWARHVQEDITVAQPRELFPGGQLDLLLASPSCVHFSNARGGAPVNDQMRSHAWSVIRWCRDLDTAVVLMENVAEMLDWGPVVNGRPVRDGSIFRRWLRELQGLGYAVEYRVLNAADYGAVTSRKRLFLMATKTGRRPAWPKQTHSRGGSVQGTSPWRGAHEVVDASLLGSSIFTRRTKTGEPRPLVPRTIARICKGLRDELGIDVTAWMNHNYEAVVAENARRAKAGRNDFVFPIVATGSPGQLLLPNEGIYGGPDSNPPKSLDEPFPTITASRGVGRILDVAVHPAREPEACPGGAFLVEYYGCGVARSLTHPVPTLTTRDRFATVAATTSPGPGGFVLDVALRMLTVREMAAAMGFTDYDFTGTQTQVVKQIGNAVEVTVARALVSAALTAAQPTLMAFQ